MSETSTSKITESQWQFLQNRLREQPSTTLYHYTSASGLIGILGSRGIWASSHLHLNDREEHKIAEGFIAEALSKSSLNERERNIFGKVRAQANTITNFVCSFSEDGDKLSQWRAYSSGGQGYALGFAPNNCVFRRSAPQHSFYLVRCIYEEELKGKLCQGLVDSFAENYLGKDGDEPLERETLASFDQVQRVFRNYDWVYSYSLVLSCLKHQGFKEEAEWRLVSQHPLWLERGGWPNPNVSKSLGFRVGRFGAVPYFALPLCFLGEKPEIDSIYIGPTANKRAATDSLRKLLNHHELKARIKLSSTPFRS